MRRALALPLLAVLVLGCASHPKLQLKWTHQSQFAGFYVAHDDLGADADLVAGGPDVSAVEEVRKGDSTYGVADGFELLLAAARGEDVAVLHPVFDRNPMVLMVREESRDRLTGKRPWPGGAKAQARPEPRLDEHGGDSVRVLLRASDAESIYLQVWAELNRVDWGRMKTVRCDGDYEDLYLEKADLMVGYRFNEFIREPSGSVPLVAWKTDALDESFGDVLFTTHAWLDAHPDEARNLVEKTGQGWSRAVAHPDEAVEAVGRRMEKTQFDPVHERQMLVAIGEYVAHFGGGGIPDERKRWEAMYDLLAKVRLVPADPGMRKATLDRLLSGEVSATP